ncbi:MAG: PIN domain-containing protein, partial [Bryobacteraceae bacterium]
MFFLDSNILVYAWDAKDQRKQSIARGLIRRALVGEGVVSQQVLGEFAAVLLHRMKPAASASDVLLALDSLANIRLVPPGAGVVRRATRSAPDDNDDAILWPPRREMQKGIPVAGQEYATSLKGKPENCLVGRIARKGPAQQRDIVAELLQQIAQVVGDVMIEQELHPKPGPSASQRAGRSLPGGLHSRRGIRI